MVYYNHSVHLKQARQVNFDGVGQFPQLRTISFTFGKILVTPSNIGDRADQRSICEYSQPTSVYRYGTANVRQYYKSSAVRAHNKLTTQQPDIMTEKTRMKLVLTSIHFANITAAY
jgi:alpha-tubulin suppressor-like RCC1 family protein